MTYQGQREVDDRGVEEVALAVHSTLTLLHLFGVIYHSKRENILLAVLHSLGAIFDGYSTIEHLIALRKRKAI